MPTISMFYGIVIRMFFYDTDKHNVPHVHAEYQDETAQFTRSKMVVSWRVDYLIKSISWSWLGLKSIKRT
jgi:hypothetical protein